MPQPSLHRLHGVKRSAFCRLPTPAVSVCGCGARPPLGEEPAREALVRGGERNLAILRARPHSSACGRGGAGSSCTSGGNGAKTAAAPARITTSTTAATTSLAPSMSWPRPRRRAGERMSVARRCRRPRSDESAAATYRRVSRRCLRRQARLLRGACARLPRRRWARGIASARAALIWNLPPPSISRILFSLEEPSSRGVGAPHRAPP